MKKPRLENRQFSAGHQSEHRVLLTGGAGYIGSALSSWLLQAGWSVTVFDTMGHGHVPASRPGLRIVDGDIRDARTVRAALKGHESVIHLAFLSTDRPYDGSASLAYSVNIDGLRILIDAALSAGVRRIIFPSSCSVYGHSCADRDTDETSPVNPLTAYAEHKLACEAMLGTASPLVHVVPRLATVCGRAPRQRLDLAINRFTLQAVVERTIRVVGPANTRPCLHIDDACSLYVKLLVAPDSVINGRILNAAFENRTLFKTALCVANSVGGADIVCVPDHPGRSYMISSDQLRRTLDFAPARCAQDAVRDIAAAIVSGTLKGPFNTGLFNN